MLAVVPMFEWRRSFDVSFRSPAIIALNGGWSVAGSTTCQDLRANQADVERLLPTGAVQLASFKAAVYSPGPSCPAGVHGQYICRSLSHPKRVFSGPANSMPTDTTPCAALESVHAFEVDFCICRLRVWPLDIEYPAGSEKGTNGQLWTDLPLT